MNEIFQTHILYIQHMITFRSGLSFGQFKSGYIFVDSVRLKMKVYPFGSLGRKRRSHRSHNTFLYLKLEMKNTHLSIRFNLN